MNREVSVCGCVLGRNQDKDSRLGGLLHTTNTKKSIYDIDVTMPALKQAQILLVNLG